MKLSDKSIRRIVQVAGTAAAATSIALLAQGPASADVFVNLPSQTDAKTLADGTKVTVVRSNERATISPSLGGTPLHRNAQVSAKYDVTTSTKAKIKVQAGYIVGCQVSVNQLTSTNNDNISNSYNTGTGAFGVATGGTGLSESLTLGPGQASTYYVNDSEKADDFGADNHSTKVGFNTKHAKLSYVGTTLNLTGCAGYAQARSIANIFISTPTTDQVITTYGRPFSLG
ncbi:MspA family porin [Williamsia sterculiae]|uniref:MspA protein n=1 Tax=Williamsia sterculiae TaxID=1344003 RepID=A0A1N7DID1_9NOCA|nr:MspA family porin [Williamsia sterculiae]SIR75558.1 MspA protein [Williamsia sterculiae]